MVLGEAVPAEAVPREAGNFIINILSGFIRCYHGGMSRDKFIIMTVLVFSAFVIHHSTYRDDNSKASIWANSEKEFFKPIDIVWRGEIISTMTSGSCIGLKGEFNNYSQAMACFPNADSREFWKFEGVVTITGKWLGITCAYKNTIFGECVPDVRIENVKK